MMKLGMSLLLDLSSKENVWQPYSINTTLTWKITSSECYPWDYFLCCSWIYEWMPANSKKCPASYFSLTLRWVWLSWTLFKHLDSSTSSQRYLFLLTPLGLYSRILPTNMVLGLQGVSTFMFWNHQKRHCSNQKTRECQSCHFISGISSDWMVLVPWWGDWGYVETITLKVPKVWKVLADCIVRLFSMKNL